MVKNVYNVNSWNGDTFQIEFINLKNKKIIMYYDEIDSIYFMNENNVIIKRVNDILKNYYNVLNYINKQVKNIIKINVSYADCLMDEFDEIKERYNKLYEMMKKSEVKRI